jgi:hypothetical protein
MPDARTAFRLGSDVDPITADENRANLEAAKGREVFMRLWPDLVLEGKTSDGQRAPKVPATFRSSPP